MRIRVSSAAVLEELLEYLESEPDAVVQAVADDEVEVSLLGSYETGAMRMELYLRLRAWEAARRASGAVVEIID
jgi:hypothetical protein